ncbi:PREDICTED: uncharacterized protein LOC109235996 [Nicotiana attenuata]|uniref:uncharacterized protein LOC109235996 n=1 Tax=Nicotiana attenuata TaxID=49451 RepID=UPI000904C087|nr:PREDICTED: uncharacterized protein LOC109235996 [Nicotiana attenuata]
MKEANEELYPGCKKFCKLSFLLHMYRTKCMFKWSNESFNALLGLLKDALPEGEKLPPSFYETKKIVEGLGLKWKNDARKIPAKVLRYFPLKPRLQRLFMSSETSKAMRWHHEERNKDGVLRHPADSEGWKNFDNKYPEFAGDPRNVRLGLASEGFNPFGTMRTVHTLGNNIDVFLQPLIEELNELWDVGVETYDASTKEIFQMRAALMWTINDFPAYGSLSGWCTYGRFAFPSCNINTQSRRLKHGRKFCYMGHRRFLKSGHKYRNDAKSFDGTKETRSAPCPVTGSVVLNQVKDIKFTLGQSSEAYKDNLEARLDLKEMKIRPSLWPQYRASGRSYLPPTFFTMSPMEKELFYEVLQNVKFPDGYASNISRCFRKRKISGLKTHD